MDFGEFLQNRHFSIQNKSLVGLSMSAPPVASFSVKDPNRSDLIKVSKTTKIVSNRDSQLLSYFALRAMRPRGASTLATGLRTVRVNPWKRPGGGQHQGEKTTKRSHTPDDPKGSADLA